MSVWSDTDLWIRTVFNSFEGELDVTAALPPHCWCTPLHEMNEAGKYDIAYSIYYLSLQY